MAIFAHHLFSSSFPAQKAEIVEPSHMWCHTPARRSLLRIPFFAAWCIQARIWTRLQSSSFLQASPLPTGPVRKLLCAVYVSNVTAVVSVRTTFAPTTNRHPRRRFYLALNFKMVHERARLWRHPISCWVVNLLVRMYAYAIYAM